MNNLLFTVGFIIFAWGLGDISLAKDAAQSEPIGIAAYGQPALQKGYKSFPYANPQAPVGGKLTVGAVGGFDSLNPYILRGRSVWDVRTHVVESLMARSYDEPFSLYGLLAEKMHTPADRSFVEFYLHPEARFSNGDPVRVEDVIWSREILMQEGQPRFRDFYSKIIQVERLGNRGVRFIFAKPDRELPLLMGLMPILPKNVWEGRNFAAGGLEPFIGSGPYMIDAVEAGRKIRLKRNPAYWGANLPSRRGTYLFDEIDYLYFRDGAAMWEAFTSGRIDLYRENDPARWVEAYDFPAYQAGDVVKGEIPHQRASGMNGFVFNTRKSFFQDRRIREAFALALDFKWLNQRLYRGGYTRINSYFSGSRLGFEDQPSAAEKALLEPFIKSGALPAETLSAPWRPPLGAGDGRNRRNLRKARKLLDQAGWRIQDGVLRNAQGAPFEFDIMVRSSGDEERVADIFSAGLKALGVVANVRVVDSAQHQERLNTYDYDMVVARWWLSLSPGAEQRFYWGSDGREQPGTRNYMGVANPAVDAMIDALGAAQTEDEFVTAVRALDRALSAGVYVVPLGYSSVDRVAWRADLRKPSRTSLYGYRPEVWWREE